jgi:propanol-preferring alcohol dehydrogenase
MHGYHQPLVLEDIPMPEIKPDEVLVRVTAAGMCRTVDHRIRTPDDIPN